MFNNKPQFNCNNSSSMSETPGDTHWQDKEETREEIRERYFTVKGHIDDGVVLGDEVMVNHEDGNTFLISASICGYTDIVELLLSSKPPPNVYARNNKHLTAYDGAENEEIRKMLLDAEKGKFPTIGLKEVQKNR